MKSGKVTETENRVITQPRPEAALCAPLQYVIYDIHYRSRWVQRI